MIHTIFLLALFCLGTLLPPALSSSLPSVALLSRAASDHISCDPLRPPVRSCCVQQLCEQTLDDPEPQQGSWLGSTRLGAVLLTLIIALPIVFAAVYALSLSLKLCPSSNAVVLAARPASPIEFNTPRGVIPTTVQREPSPLGLTSPDITWFILVIAAGVDGLRDPALDLFFLREVFEASNSIAVSFRWLSDPEVTRGRIRDAVCSLYDAAQQGREPSRFLIYLTGMGDGCGRMRLSENTVISEQDLGVWLADLDRRTESLCSWPVVSVWFNICRETMGRQNPALDYNLGLVWSCSVGQLAYAIGLDKGLPSSCFLISLFVASHDALVGSGPFEDAFAFRINQLGNFLQFIYRRRHEAAKACEHCKVHGKCDLPELQKLDYEPAGLSTLVSLGELIISGHPNYAHAVFNALNSKMERCGFFESVKPEFIFSRTKPMASYSRGANKRLSQAAGLN